MLDLNIGGRSFRDIESYKAAKRDFDNIEAIKSRHDLTKLEDVKKIRDNIEEGNYRFESMLGDDFLDELEELIAQLEEDKALSRTGRKGFKPFKNKETKNEPKFSDEKDEKLDAEIKRQVKKREIKRKAMIVIASLVSLGCIVYLAFYYTLYAKNDVQYSNLSDLIDEESTPKEYSVNIVHEDTTMPPVLKKYEKLYQKNKKLVGWIKIDGTNID